MSEDEKKEWKRKLAPKLTALDGVSGVETGKIGIIVNIEKNDEAIRQRVMDLLEQEAIDLPYKCKVSPYRSTSIASV